MTRRQSGRRRRGPYIHSDYSVNHAIWPGRHQALEAFLSKPFGGLRNHKTANAYSSHSEDALTWSCFEGLLSVRPDVRRQALGEIWSVAFNGAAVPNGVAEGTIEVGRVYGADEVPGERAESTEVDASIDGPSALVFFEAKLYSAMSQAELPKKPHNQIARKLRVGLREAQRTGREFYFIILDLAPPEMLRALRPGVTLQEAESARSHGFASKWLTAYWFSRYKRARGGSTGPLADVLDKADAETVQKVARNMGWLTWADLFKTVLRAVIANSQ